MLKEKNWLLYIFTALAILLIAVGVFDRGLAVGFAFLVFLTVATTAIAYKMGVKDKQLYVVFLIALAVHLAAVLFIYYYKFNPFGGGADYDGYNQTAIELAHRFWQGNFSLKGFYTEHFFPILIAMIYMVTLPGMLVGQFFTVWLAGTAVFLTYLIVVELGGTKKAAFLASLLAIAYPSYLFFGSLLLKDTVVIPLVFAGILLILKMTKHFSWPKFLLFFVILTALINLRFYVGYALMFSLIFSWPLLSVFPIKKRAMYWLVMVFLLGFSSQIVGNGYYGFNSFKSLLNPKAITYYREVVYSPNSPLNVKPSAPPVSAPPVSVPKPSISQPTVTQPIVSAPQKSPVQAEVKDNGSTFLVETGFNGGPISFLKNSLLSFTYSLLGPFPWQFTQKRQIVGLAETIPWYVIILMFAYGSIKHIKKNGFFHFLQYNKFSLPLLIFAVSAIGALSLFINNYGIIARIRIPMVITLVLIMCMNLENFRKEIS